MPTLVELATQIVAAQASMVPMSTDHILTSLRTVHSTLGHLNGNPANEVAEEPAAVKVTWKDAFKEHEVVCMVCGKGGFQLLGKHLTASHGLTRGAYRDRFGIPNSQPLAAGAYTEKAAQKAIDSGAIARVAGSRAAVAEKAPAGKSPNEEAKPKSAARDKAPRAAKSAKPVKSAKIAKAAKTAKPEKAAKPAKTAPAVSTKTAP